MSEASYRRQLTADLPRWREKGWVTADGASAILASLDARARPAAGLSGIVGFFGAILIGVGVLAFVAANWEGLARQVRFSVLLGAMAVAYGLAIWLRASPVRFFADAAVLVGSLIFGAAIVLVGQSYHLTGDFADAVLMWTVGCLAAGLLASSVSATALAVVGAGYWTGFEAIERESTQLWPGLGLMLAAAAVATQLQSRAARSFAVLGLYYFAGFQVLAYATEGHWPFAGTAAVGVSIALTLWALGEALGAFKSERISGLGSDLLAPSLAVFLVAFAALQWRHGLGVPAAGQQWIVAALVGVAAAIALAGSALVQRSLGVVDLAAAAAFGGGAIALAVWVPPDRFVGLLVNGGLTLLAITWVVWRSQNSRRRAGMAIGLVAFGLEVLYLYVETLGPILDRAMAFIAGGVLFVAVAALLFRVDRHLARRRLEQGT